MDLLSFSRAVSENALRVRGFILIPREQFVQPVVSGFVKKPLDIRARKPIQRVVAKACVVDEDRAGEGDSFRSEAAFLADNNLGLALEFREIDLFTAKL